MDRDALSKLPEFEWRGKKYPVSSSRHSFRHENAEHRVSYGGLTLVEPLGPQNPTFSFTLPMDQGIAKGPYKDLFKQVPTLAHDMYDRSPGPLVDPVFGTWTVNPVDFQSDLDAQHRSGVGVQVSFMWAPELDKDVRRTGGVDSLSSLASDAAALDAELVKLARRFDQESRRPTINPLDLVSNITGQLSRQIDKVGAQIKHLTYQVEKSERFTAELIRQTKDPDAFGAHREARRIRASLVRTQRQLNAAAKDVVQVQVAQAKNLLTLAAEEGMSVKEFLSLNADLARSPVVAAGTTISVIRKAA